MGQTLSEPVTKKESFLGGDSEFIYGLSGMQGWRISMEDAHLASLNVQSSREGAPIMRLFAVFDGHGGSRVAQYCGENFQKVLKDRKEFEQGDYVKALENTFLELDVGLLSNSKYADEPSGCTATAVLIGNGDTIYCANAGDSRTVIGIKGIAKPLSFDHKPQNETEKDRICKAGGFVDFGRVNGNLALSRAIGDFEFKKNKDLPPQSQIVTAFPDVVEHIMTDSDEFIVLACDGIWDCKSSQEVIEFVRRGIASKMNLDKIAENLMENCLSSTAELGGVGCDNMTVIVVGILRGLSQEDWYNMIAERVENDDGPCAPTSAANMKTYSQDDIKNDEKCVGSDDLVMDDRDNIKYKVEVEEEVGQSDAEST